MSNEWTRYLIEWGCGATLSHEDPELAAERAVMNATAHVCPLNFEALNGIDMEKDLKIDILIGVPYPEKVDPSKIAALIPYNCEKNIKIINGGLIGKGVRNQKSNRLIDVIIAVAFITIYVRKKFH